jgi:hypothetical protein
LADQRIPPQKQISGNPAGRPKKVKPITYIGDSVLDDARRAELNRTISVRVDGKDKTAPLAAVFKAQPNLALRDNAMAQRSVIRNADLLERRDAQRCRASKSKNCFMVMSHSGSVATRAR